MCPMGLALFITDSAILKYRLQPVTQLFVFVKQASYTCGAAMLPEGAF